MKRVFIFLITIILIMCSSGCGKIDSKIQICYDDKTRFVDEGFVFKESDDEHYTAIEVFVVCDYSRHEKYDEWMEEYYLKDYENNLDKWLNGVCYETIKDKYKHGEFTQLNFMPVMHFTYMTLDDLSKDYIEFVKLSKKNYVRQVYIRLEDTSKFHDE